MPGVMYALDTDLLLIIYRVSKKSRDGWICPQVKYFSKK